MYWLEEDGKRKTGGDLSRQKRLIEGKPQFPKLKFSDDETLAHCELQSQFSKM